MVHRMRSGEKKIQFSIHIWLSLNSVADMHVSSQCPNEINLLGGSVRVMR